MLRALITLLLLINSAHAAENGQFCPGNAFNQQSLQMQQSKLLIFVSFSMPEESIKQLSVQAKKINAPLVIRGLVNNSYKETLSKVAAIAQSTGNGVSIDPRLFEQYQISKVPSVVVINDGGDYDKVSGNVSLNYALQFLSDQNQTAKSLLEKLEVHND